MRHFHEHGLFIDKRLRIYRQYCMLFRLQNPASSASILIQNTPLTLVYNYGCCSVESTSPGGECRSPRSKRFRLKIHKKLCAPSNLNVVFLNVDSPSPPQGAPFSLHCLPGSSVQQILIAGPVFLPKPECP